MDKKDFEKQMYEEWRKNTLDHYIGYCETKEFDQLKDLRECDKIYYFFHPIMSHKSDMASIAEMCWRIKKTDLSIVIANIELPNRYKTPPADKAIIDIYDKLSKKIFCIKSIFVVSSYYTDVDNEGINSLIGTYKRDCTLIDYSVFNFNSDVLSILHSFIPRFLKTNSMLEEAYEKQDDSVFMKLSDHKKYEMETLSMIEKAIIDYEALRKLR